jgi:hypothetical protein
MPDTSLDATCRECGRTLSLHPGEERPARCAPCFDGYLRAIDHDFLASYAELGVTSRRTVAETCLRGLVLESPPARKVLAMAIVEQFLLASADLIGLTHAIRDRDQQPIIQSFLSFRLDGESSSAFFADLLEAPDTELLSALGLPAPELVVSRYPALAAADARDLGGALHALLRDLRATAQRSSSALLLSELAGNVRGGPALADKPSWLFADPGPGAAMRPDQVASLVLDERRRQLVAQAVPVDEQQLGEVVDAIDCMTGAASNLVYAYLTVQDEEARQTAIRNVGPQIGTDDHR